MTNNYRQQFEKSEIEIENMLDNLDRKAITFQQNFDDIEQHHDHQQQRMNHQQPEHVQSEFDIGKYHTQIANLERMRQEALKELQDMEAEAPVEQRMETQPRMLMPPPDQAV